MIHAQFFLTYVETLKTNLNQWELSFFNVSASFALNDA